MTTYHGRLIDCTTRNWQEGLPQRKDLLDPETVAVTERLVQQNKPLFFLPLTFTDHMEREEGRGCYRILAVGILPCGTKAAVCISGVWPQLEVRVPEGKQPARFKERLLEELKEAGTYGLRFKDDEGESRIELRQHYPLKYHQEKEAWYVKLEFNTHLARAGALKYLKGRQYETAIDDKGQYYRVAARQFRYSPCGWNRVRRYELLDRGTLTVPGVRYCFALDISNFTPAGINLALPENRHYAQDRSLLMGWDLETYNRKNTSRAPMPEDIHLPEATAWAKKRLREMRPEDLQGLIEMACCSFGWYCEPEATLRVCVTCLPVPPQDYCLTLQVRDQQHLLEVLHTLVGRMEPEMCGGFNDGRYDWPFVKERVQAYDMTGEFRRSLSSMVVADDENRARWTAGFITKEFKLEADQKVNLTHYMAPGLVCLDVRAIFQKLYPGTEESSLNFYLSKNELKLKEDMPIPYMNRIMRIARQLVACLNAHPNKEKEDKKGKEGKKGGGRSLLPTHAEMLALLDEWAAAGVSRPFADIELEAATGGSNPLYGRPVDPSSYGLERLTLDEIRKHLLDAGLVARYCCTDAESCHRLLYKRKVVNDKREAGELSFTDLYDCCTRADGMRVRSVVIAEAIKPEWNLAVSNWTGDVAKTDDKYPGAYVLHPKKGLYRDTRAVKAERRKRKRQVAMLPFENTKSADDKEVTKTAKTPEKPQEKTAGSVNTPEKSQEKAGPAEDLEEEPLANEDPDVDGAQASARASKRMREEYVDDDEQPPESLVPPTTAELLHNNDVSEHTDRPCTGLDFSSLYPSEVMNDNCSPEKIIVDPEEAARLTTPDADGNLPLDRWGHPYRLREISFYYGKKGDPNTAKQHIHGWVVAYTPIALVTDPKTAAKREVSAYELSEEELQRKPPIVRYDGFGIYPHVLRLLFDKRAEYKKQMEEFGGPMKILNECVLKQHKLEVLASKPVEEQWEAVFGSLAGERLKREAEYAAKPKDYYKYRLKEIKELEEYFAGARRAAEAGETSFRDVPQLYAELVYNEGYFNRKQNIMKVFMNTFYGETGNTQSAFFMVEVAGAITTGGQWALKTVRAFVEPLGYRAMYGDTDSLYLCCPDAAFVGVDEDYRAGRLTKRQYWEAMIEITMEDLTQLKDRVNHYLFLKTRKRFLKMAYEEVLWPVLYLGKKKYAGIQHLGIPNLAMCEPGVPLEKFLKDKSLFIRGLELKKRGSSQFLKLICGEVLQRAMCLTTEETLLEIVLAVLKEIPQRTWDPKVFVKTAKYKLAGRGKDGLLKPGNRVVLPFMERMARLQQEHPELGIGPTELGDRFEYVNAKRQPWHYTESGRKIKIGAHERVEFLRAVGHKAYEELVGPVEPDLQHYITGEVIGQLSRFVSYHPRFLEAAAASGRPLPDAAAVNLEDENEADDFYKRLDDMAFQSAKRELTHYYNTNFGTEWVDDSKTIRAAYRTAARDLYDSWEMRYGDQNDAMFLLEKAVQERQTSLQPIIRKTIEEAAKTRAKKFGLSPYAAVRKHLSAYDVHRVYVAGGVLQRRRQAARAQLLAAQGQLSRLLPILEGICRQEQVLLHKLLAEESLTEEDEADEAEGDDQALNRQYLANLEDCYTQICAAHLVLFTSERFESDIKNDRARSVGATPMPTGVREQFVQARRTRNADFHDWLKRNSAADSKEPLF